MKTNQIKKYAGMNLCFGFVRKTGGGYAIFCYREDDDQSMIVGLKINGGEGIFESEAEAIKYWNDPADGSDVYNGKVIGVMEV